MITLAWIELGHTGEAVDKTYRNAKEHGKATLDLAAVYHELRDQNTPR